MSKERFELKKEHVQLLQAMYVYFDDSAYHGAPAVDIKRPYGNGGVASDVQEILGWTRTENDEAETRALDLHRETAQALQVVLASRSFEPGIYEADVYKQNWRKIS